MHWLKVEMNLAILGGYFFLLRYIVVIIITFFRQVLDVIAAVRNENPEELSEIIYNNSERLFFSK